jgi:hypothetical protein
MSVGLEFSEGSGGPVDAERSDSLYANAAQKLFPF